MTTKSGAHATRSSALGSPVKGSPTQGVTTNPERSNLADQERDRHSSSVPSGQALANVARFVRDVEEALREVSTSRRVGLAGVHVSITVPDAGSSVHLLLDRDPPVVGVGRCEQRPTVRLTLDAVRLRAMLRDSTYLPMAILAGSVSFEGPVRKLLRVLPVLRASVERADARRR